MGTSAESYCSGSCRGGLHSDRCSVQIVNAPMPCDEAAVIMGKRGERKVGREKESAGPGRAWRDQPKTHVPLPLACVICTQAVCPAQPGPQGRKGVAGERILHTHLFAGMLCNASL